MAYETVVPPYLCPSTTIDQLHTTYTGMVGPDAALPSTEGRPIPEFTDGTSNTVIVIVIEAPPNDAVHWMAPQDVGVEFLMSLNEESKIDHIGGVHAAFADGSVRFLPTRTPEANRQALITPNAGDTVEW